MYSTLKAEMARKGVTGRELARSLNLGESTFSLKINGRSEFDLSEAKAIKDELGVNIPLEELFEK